MESPPKVTPFANMLNSKENRRKKLEKVMHNFDNWCKKNPYAAGKEKIFVPEKTQFEKFYKFKRARLNVKDRSFDLFTLSSDMQKVKSL